MRISEILTEMSVKRKKAEQIFSSLESEINMHLLKLMGLTASEETRNHWKRELRTWATRLSIITLKDDDRPVPCKDVLRWLYGETFGGSRELKNVQALLALLSEDYDRNNQSPEEIATKLADFHKKFALRISKNDRAYDLINSL